MDIWTVPLIIVVLIIGLISFVSVRKWNKANAAVEVQDSRNPAVVEEDHPFTLNPIIWIALASVFFMGIVIFYYATSSF
ncbi:hypothetical protein [Sporosarcina sp. JAI121]|uniref:hypothetical protein n=1 Tax=Sporosarcina sp. JAI121 TaxID=2723064 RepID=UPI0015CB4A45|nr:hypothetical protein [Sporosarcina sp. JAI121]NYF24061.1 hypothetical protein [Sporosarcina sp. JAI121]